eukprot:3194679-Amphidinium_carterae.1
MRKPCRQLSTCGSPRDEERVNGDLQRQGKLEETWLGDNFEFQLIVANTPQTIQQYNKAVAETITSLQTRRIDGEVITTAHQTRLLQESIENFDCDTMAVVVFSWAHTSKETKMFRPTKPQHTRTYRTGYHLELTSTVLGLRPRNKDFHTVLNVVVTDWTWLYKQHFMNEVERARYRQHSDAEWKRLRIEREEKQGYSRRKHGVQDMSRFEDYYYSEQRSARSRGRGTGWQER